MSIPSSRIEENLGRIRGQIQRAADRAGRNASEVALVAITKSVGTEEIRTLQQLGVTDFGENRVESARAKRDEIGEGPRWHMVGNIQRRKVRDVLGVFDTVDAVDRLPLAQALHQHCQVRDTRLDILLEVNVSGESAKHGFAPVQLEAALEKMRAMDRLHVHGLMTMAPFGATPAELRAIFAALRHLGEKLALKELSMGMSGDFEIAIEEGATQVRIGSALFE